MTFEIVFHKWNENKQMQLLNGATTLIEKDMRLSDEPYILWCVLRSGRKMHLLFEPEC